MSLRLLLAAHWLPQAVLRRELDEVARRTTGALDELLQQYAPEMLPQIRSADAPMIGTLDQRRAAMAAAHQARVAALLDRLGPQEAIRLGREALFRVGLGLGQEARRRLGVGRGVGDVLRAARVLYPVLGIHFRVQWHGGGQATLHVRRCALAAHYSEMACVVLSAADEGVVQGLCPGMSMAFAEYMTAGAPGCRAHLRLAGHGGG